MGTYFVGPFVVLEMLDMTIDLRLAKEGEAVGVALNEQVNVGIYGN